MCPHQESNPDLSLRTGLLYPLSYEDKLSITLAHFWASVRYNSHMQPEADHAEMKHLLKRQMELLEENNRLLRKLHRSAVWGFWFRLSTYLFILGAPVVLYYYVFAPYLDMMGSDYQTIMETLERLGGLEQLNRFLEPPR